MSSIKLSCPKHTHCCYGYSTFSAPTTLIGYRTCDIKEQFWFYRNITDKTDMLDI